MVDLDEMPVSFTTRPKRKNEELMEPMSKSDGQELLQNESSKKKHWSLPLRWRLQMLTGFVFII